MNSREFSFDWHHQGIWVMCCSGGEPIHETIADTPYSCRTNFLRQTNTLWSKAKAAGFYVQQLAVPSAPALRAQEQVTSTESYWRYPATGRVKDQPPGGESLLLTEGRICVTGTWTGSGGFIAWAPKIQRDKALEEQLGLL